MNQPNEAREVGPTANEHNLPLTKVLNRITPILGRYGGLAAQFLVTVIIARETSLEVAGQYFAIFAMVSVGYTTVGLGASDGLVRLLPGECAEGAISGEGLRLARQCIAFSIVCTLLLGIVPISIAAVWQPSTLATVSLVSVWWTGYCIVFLSAQVMVGIGRTNVGAFAAYAVINITCLCVVGLFSLIVDNLSLDTILILVAGGTTVASALTFSFLVVVLQKARRSYSTEEEKPPSEMGARNLDTVRALIKYGMPMMIARLGQAAIPWVPVWVFVVCGLPASGALYAAASRIVVIATAVIAALRFSSRHEIVLRLKARMYGELLRLSLRSSALAICASAASIAVVATVGDKVLPAVFGTSYSESVAFVQILLLATVAEAFGGLSDEILKMMGRTYVVIGSIFLALLVQLGSSLTAVNLHSVIIAAYGTVVAFSALYGLQVVWLWRNTNLFRRPIRENSLTMTGVDR